MKGTKRRRCISAFCTMAVLLMLAAPTVAKAEDSYTNWGYTFEFGYTGHQWETGGRNKVTQSEAFLYIEHNDTRGVRFRLDGGTSATGPWNTSLTRGGSAYASGAAQGYYLIHNYVNENGYSFARLAGVSVSGDGVISGVWSPDTREPWHPSLN